ncbi:hypothetical protein BGZ65_000602 [Modicella reniformis]|uniref:Uncharacterized protein n=1 Tax=Modicella reniformis TaxID=1440133 RepID=A0A9P6SQI4_9FUNG|nr:hypothetical protein BGZ65_000602 [Modicella reniformis]
MVLQEVKNLVIAYARQRMYAMLERFILSLLDKFVRPKSNRATRDGQEAFGKLKEQFVVLLRRAFGGGDKGRRFRAAKKFVKHIVKQIVKQIDASMVMYT